MSILLTATIIGTSAALAWSIASTVWGITPSSAATTSDHDVGHLAAAGAHGGEGLVARRVEEGERRPSWCDLVRADVLGDAAGLAGGHLGLADGVEQRGLAVVDVTHDRDDRRALDHLVGRVVVDRLVGHLVGRVLDVDLLVEAVGQDLDRLVREGWVRVAISPSSMSFLMTSPAERPSDSATSFTVAPDLISVTGISCGLSGWAVRSGSTHGVRRRRPRRRGGACC